MREHEVARWPALYGKDLAQLRTATQFGRYGFAPWELHEMARELGSSVELKGP